MCTVTIVPVPGRDDGSFRLSCNRDELRSRGPERPPREARFGRRRGVMPIDSHAGGTWIGANDAGLVLSLLNLTSPEDAAAERLAPGRLSRGAIIPALMHHDHVGAAIAAVMRLDPAAQRPFRLVMVDRHERAIVRSDGLGFDVVVREARRDPFMITSSGLGDHLVERPRREAFDEMFGGPVSDPVATQAAFHRIHWPDHGGVSVSLDRREALTVSQTVVTVGSDAIDLTYRTGPPHLAGDADDAVAVRLALAGPARTAG